MKNNLPVVILKGVVLLPNCDLRIEFDNDYHKSILDVSELFHDNKVLIIVKENELEETDDIKKLPKKGVVASISHKNTSFINRHTKSKSFRILNIYRYAKYARIDYRTNSF